MRAVFVLGCFLLAIAAYAEEDRIDENLLKLFEPRVYRKGSSIPYRLFKPEKYDAKQKYPLILFLHGGAGIGKDNRRQFNAGNEVPAKTLTSAQNQAKYPCFILAPQCPPHEGWVRLDRRLAEPMVLTLALMSSLQKQFSIDPDRLYVIGLSMGGGAVWDLLSQHPKMFAAAVPICSAGDPGRASLLTHLPVWCFHGDADPLIPVQYARAMIDALRKAGAHPKYTEYPGVGHNSYVNAFQEPELLPWLFKQKRNSNPPPNGS
jgi:predicted peptidase